MSPSADGVTPTPDLETEIAEELRRQLAAARTQQTSGEVAQRHETVLSNIMLPGQAAIEPGEAVEAHTAFTSDVPAAGNEAPPAASEEETVATAPVDLTKGDVADIATSRDTPLQGDSSAAIAGSSYLPAMDEVVFNKMPTAATQAGTSEPQANVRPDVITTAVNPPPPDGPAVNHDPTAGDPIANQTADEDAGFTFQIPASSFSDVDAGDHLAYTATLADGSALPAWLTFDPVTRTFSGTPGNDDVGNISVKVVATDDAGAFATQTFTVSVANTNDGPVASAAIADQAATEDSGFSFQVPVASFTDVDVGDHLAYTATLADGSALPAWLTFDPATRTFSGTPGNDDVGQVSVKVVATDDAGASATQTFTVSVANTNDGPVASAQIANQAATEDSGFTFTVPSNSFTDVDVGDHLAYTATLADGSALPAWLTFDPATRTFSGTPGNDDVGQVSVKITATDDAGASATQTFTVSVANTNDGPIASAAIADQAATEDASFSFQVPANSFTDVDVGDHLAYTATLFDGSALPAWLTFDPATRTFSGTPGNDDVGQVSVKVTATDDAGASATQTFTVSVANTNDGPVASAQIVDQAATENSGFSFQVPANSFTDVDVGDHLAYTATLADGSALPAWLTFDPATRTFSGTPGNDDVGQVSVKITATDDAGASATQTFTVSVANTNDGPVAPASIADQAATEDAGFSFQVPANSFTDVDAGDHLAYTATLADGSALPAWLTFDPATRTFSGTPGNDDVGQVSVKITATDDAGASATQTFTVSVANTNDGPVASAQIADQAATEDAGFSFQVPANSFTDVDVGDHLAYTATLADGSALPAWLTFDPVTHTFSGTPGNDDVGQVSVKVTATDDAGASATQTFTVSVANTNDGPVASAQIVDQAATEDAGFSFQVPANSFTDVDVGDHLAYTATLADGSALPVWLTFDPATRTFSGTPGNDDVGQVSVKITATDDAGASSTQTFTVSVANTNDAPVITSGTGTSVPENITGAVYQATATDADAGDTITYSLSGADAALFNIDATTGAVTFKSSPDYDNPADAGQDNVYNVTVNAFDGKATTSQDVAITVTNVNEGPTVTSGATATFAENGTGTVYIATASDPDTGTTLTYSISGADADLFNIDATTGAVTFKSAPNYEAPGDTGGDNVYDIKVTASDGSLTSTKDVAITVTNVNEGPTATSGATATFAENGTGTVYTATATDPDAGTTLTYSISGTDAALFNIDAATGAVTFKSAPDYEAPADAGGNNVYDIKVTASDGTNSTTQNVAITVTNVNEGPTVTSGSAATFAENGTGTVYTATASDPDAGTSLTYSISGADAALFNIDAATGAVTFKSAPNYEAPADAGGNNVYDIKVTASDGNLTSTTDVAITVTNVNEGPSISTSAMSPAQSAAPMSEITLRVSGDMYQGAPQMRVSVDGVVVGTYTVTADHATGTWQDVKITGDFGAAGPGNVRVEYINDAWGGVGVGDRNLVVDKIIVNGTTFEAEAADYHVGSNVLHGSETMAWQGYMDFQTSGAAPGTGYTVAENATGPVVVAQGTDPDAGTTLTYSLSGEDAALFNINTATGEISFKSAPDYEAASDAGGNNVYNVVVTTSDGVNSASEKVVITVANVNEGPTITSGATASFAENGTGTVYTATATDPDAGTTLTYSISGTDAALFNIDATTGVVTFKSAPNYEAPADAGANNVYDIKVTASDGSLSSTKDVAITVTNVNEGPTVTSSATATFAENGTGTVYTATATDPDAGTTLTYSISGTDAALFNIDATTGVVTFKSAPNYEAPADAGANNVYDIKVSASDGSLTSTKDVAITVTNVNEGPTVTSGATATFAENGTSTVYTATATDPDAGTNLTYSISGTDAALFNIDAATGVVTFKSAPNYEAPSDAGGNNVYDIKVTASDGSLTSTKDLAITVTNVNEGPTVTSSTTASFTENGTGTVYQATATDPDAGTNLTYSISGTDAALFNIDATTGVVTFKSAPNYEAPTDAGGNNVYDIKVTASDGSLSSTKDVAITVTNVNEGPTVTSGATATYAENGSGTAYTATATDPDAGTTLTYSISGTDAALFNIDATTGVVTFKSAPNYEAPADAGGNNVYDIKVTASDGSLTSTKDVAITVTNVNEGPTVTSGAAASFAENGTGTVYTATATDPDAGTTLTYSISGTDAALFNIDAATGVVTFKSAPNYEAPADAGGNNVYDIKVTASDGSLTSTKDVAITVTNVNEGPTVTSGATATFAENGTGTVYTATATDPDAGTTLTYSISGTDAALFNINATTGIVTFKSTPNYEAPADAGGNNVYDIKVTASDGSLTSTKDVAITVTNVNEGPTSLSVDGPLSVEETVASGGTIGTANDPGSTQPVVATLSSTDPDSGETLTYSLVGGATDLFTVQGNQIVVAAGATLDYETTPTHEVTVRVTDSAGNFLDKTVTIAVTNYAGDYASKDEAVQVQGTSEEDRIVTGAGNDTIFGSDGADTISAGAGTDTVDYSNSDGPVSVNLAEGAGDGGDATGDRYEGVENIIGTRGDDKLVGDDGDNVLTGGEGADYLSGGRGFDTADYSASKEGVYVSLSEGLGKGGDATGDVLESIENVIGSTGDDTLIGDAGDNVLAGGQGADVLVGGEGNDTADYSASKEGVYVNLADGNGKGGDADGDKLDSIENIRGSANDDIFVGNSADNVITGGDGSDTLILTGNYSDYLITYDEKTEAFTITDMRKGSPDGTDTVSQVENFQFANGTITVKEPADLLNEAPTFVSGTAATVAENTSGTVYTASATDPDPLTTVTYSLSGSDAALFNIDANTGAVTFKSAPNYEAPADAGGNNVYDINVTASDGRNTTTQAVAITVTNVNEGPTVTSGATASFAENGTGTVYTATATDPDAGTNLTYSISGTDAALFNIDATTGVVTFKSAPNYEAPADSGGNNVYDIKVTASDGSLTSTKDVAITVTNVNEGPTVASGATATFAENGTGTVYTATATDPDAGTNLTYSISGTDAALFNIDATTGAVTFKSAPNYEAPADAGGNNVYDIKVTASDGSLTSTKDVAITVTNVNEGPTVTSGATANFAENGTGTVYTATATDPDAGTTLTYSISGTDAALFNINATTGAVTFKSAPNYEAPANAGGNNVYDIKVTASDGSLSTTKDVAITVTNVNEGPTVTSGATATFAENGTGTVYTATATDPDAGTTLTYSISGTDAALFNIDAATGVVTFKSAPNYESPADAGANNVYDIKVTASDGSLNSTKDVAITVTNVNEGPTVTSGATATFAENGTGTVYTATATDPDAGTTLTYSISGTDAALFNIDATTGVVTFKSAPNYEAPADAGGNNVYDIKVTASDGSLTSTKDVAITVTNVNEGPTVTSGATASFAENGTGTVYTATATDPDAGTTLTYSISGTDAALFNINATTGAVTFKSAPNYEAPADAGGNNVYDIKVTASDGSLTSTKDVAITVTNVNEGPTVTSGATATFAENGTGTVYTATATDPDAGTTLTYSISGTDAALFNIDSSTGVVTFKSAPNYEAPSDTGGNNVYDIKVTASDGSLTSTKDVAITVTNVNEGPTVASSGTATFAENGTGTVYTATATDPDAGTTLTYSISGTDAALFNIDATTGAVTFKSAPNYEAPADNGGNNVYDIKVTASDGSLTSTKDVAITVTNVNEGPTVTSGATASFAENGTGTVYTATATDPDAGTNLTYSISGTDAALFNIDATTGVVTFKSAPDYEAPADAGGNNVYDIKVTASDGSLTSTKDVAITVTNLNEGPTVTSGATASFAENGTGTVYTATATDPDAGTTLTYSISGTDAALFNIDATTGAVTFKSAPNYEAPTDAGGNNVYDIKVTASDGSLTSTKDVAITVTNLNEGPIVTSGATASFAENGTGTVYTATATDPDAGTTLTYSISGTDAALFNINATTGAVTFKSAPNYEAPADAGGNNVYDIKVTASDGSLSSTKDVAITVTNVNEGPTVTSGATATFAENGTGTVYTATATDPDAGTTLTYSISGTDAALFNINATTGVVTFKTAPNYEAPADAGGNNVYDIKVTASDGSLTSTKDVAITVTNVNEGPTVTSAASATFAENGTGTVYTATATDQDAGSTLTYSISGTDAALFNINATTGAVTFKSAPNYEAPTDAGGNNIYDIKVTASDGSLSTTKDVAITVTNVNEGPTNITVSGSQSVQETVSSGGTIGTAYDPGSTQPVVATFAAVDPDASDTATYAIVGTSSQFVISGNQLKVASGVTFDYETTPSYTLTIRVTDSGGLTYDKSVTVNIANYAGSYTGTAGNDTATGTSEEDTMSGGDGNDTLNGGAGNDTIDGGNGNDVIVGGAGRDTLTGGAGTDTVDFSASTSGVALSFSNTNGTGVGGLYTNTAAGGYSGDATGDTYSGFEVFIGTDYADYVGSGATNMTFYLGAGNDVFDTNDSDNAVDTVYGGAGNDTMWAGNGNDILIGGAGDDALWGEAGSDTASYIDATAGVTVSLATTSAQNTGGAGTDTLNSIENLYGSTFADTLTGDGNANVISGDAGNDTIVGAAGNDTLDGGDGDDTIQGGTGDDVMTGGAGNDWVNYSDGNSVTVNLSITTAQNTSMGNDTLSGFENILGSSGSDTLTGDANANIIYAGAGNDTLDGGAGDDTLNGGSGNDIITGGSGIDTVTYFDATSAVTVNLATTTSQNTSGSGNDTITGVENLVGSIYNDTLTGDANANSIWGGAGNDTINGGDGNDIINGGAGSDNLTGGNGIDTLSYDGSSAGVTVNLANNTVSGGDAQGDTITGFENVTGSSYNDTLTAAAAGSVLDGGAGNDILRGGNGNDTIYGGAGDDYVYASGGVDYIDGGSGSDTIDYSVGTQDMTIDLNAGQGYYTSYPAGADNFYNFENSVGGSANDTLIGNAFNNTMSGGAGNDTFYGGGGNDTLIGGDGADLFMINAGLGNDTIIGGAGASWIDAIDLHDASGASYAGAFPSDWTLVMTSGSVVSTGTETMNLSTDAAGYIQHNDGTRIDFSQIEQIRW